MIINKLDDYNAQFDETSIGEICPQHDRKVTETDRILFRIFSYLRKEDFFNYALINKQSLANCKRLKSLTQPMLENFVDMSSLINLDKCLGNESQAHYLAAQKIACLIYESKPRCIKTSDYGLAFPMSAEVISYAMQLAKNENVLEIAGASGENSALLAFSGAKHVYMNDIESSEMQDFKNLCKTLPENVQAKLTPIESSCFDILKHKPELEGKIGLVLCQNLIHFFNDEKQSDFVLLLKKLLRPNGKAIIVANTTYTQEAAFKIASGDNPHQTSFGSTQCYLTDYAKSIAPIAVLYREIYPCNSEKVCTDYENVYLYYNNSHEKSKMERDLTGIKKLEPSMQTIMKTVIKDNLDIIANIQRGSVRVVTHHVHYYTEKNLSDLFEIHGFKVETTFLISEKGHLVHGEDKTSSKRIGIVLTNKNLQ